MSDIVYAENHISYMKEKRRISDELAHTLLTKLHQNDKFVISLFKTLEWSSNEDAFFEKIHQIPLLDGKIDSNFSTETSLKPKSRPPSIIVPFNRCLNYYAKDNHNTSIEGDMNTEKEMKQSQKLSPKKTNKPVFLSKMKCSHDLKFESDLSENEEKEEKIVNMDDSINSLDLDISRNSDNKDKIDKVLGSVTNFFQENKEKTNYMKAEKMMEKSKSRAK